MKGGAVYTVELADGRSFDCREGQSILAGMERAGIKELAGCRGGGCGICKVKVRGSISTCKMSAGHIGEAERREGIVLACCAYPRSDLYIEIV